MWWGILGISITSYLTAINASEILFCMMHDRLARVSTRRSRDCPRRVCVLHERVPIPPNIVPGLITYSNCPGPHVGDSRRWAPVHCNAHQCYAIAFSGIHKLCRRCHHTAKRGKWEIRGEDGTKWNKYKGNENAIHLDDGKLLKLHVLMQLDRASEASKICFLSPISEPVLACALHLHQICSQKISTVHCSS